MSTTPKIRWHADPAEVGMDRDTLLEGVAAMQVGCAEGRHGGGQGYVGRGGRPVLEYAVGEAAPGVPMTTDSLVCWFSACKPLTAMALALLYERGELDLDDPVQRYLPDFGHGKESCTLRHVLTHQGGFPHAASHADTLEWGAVLEQVCAHPAEFEPGSKAAYHSTSAWFVLGEVIQRVDGRPLERFLTEELLQPLGMEQTRLTVTAEHHGALQGRLAQVHLGQTDRPNYADQAFVDQFNSASQMALLNPSGGFRGPARELGRFYDWLLDAGVCAGRPLLARHTVELFTACHRWGLPDLTLGGAPLAWGLGFSRHGNADIHRDYSRRSYGHSGMVSTVGWADPEEHLSCVVLTTGLLDPMTNARRLREISGAAVRACGQSLWRQPELRP